jgi:hypothetical protein
MITNSLVNKIPSKAVTKRLLKKSQKAVTVTHICRLFTDKSCIKVLQKESQRVTLFLVTVTKCGTFEVYHF